MFKLSMMLILISTNLIAYNTDEKFNQKITSIISDFISPTINVSDLKRIQTTVILLDAREPNEFLVSHLMGAINIGYKKSNVNSLNLSKEKEIVVYCSVGYRSGDIADQLIKKGYKVKNLYGGIFEWVNQGNPVYDQKNMKTKKVHGYDKKWSKWLLKGEIVL